MCLPLVLDHLVTNTTFSTS
uniref:Uncharacterized protein n=1 Tax=Rhizophora mucronata TaxID=61149 RepID=A0A2P2QJC1_RHIMU